MRWCNNCESEYQEEAETCPDCGLPLKRAPGLVEVPFSDENLWTVVHKAADPHQAEMIHGVLESNGIKSTVWDRRSTLKFILGTTVYEGEVDIYVLKDKAEQAAELIKYHIQWTDEELTKYMEKKGELDDEWIDEDEVEDDEEDKPID